MFKLHSFLAPALTVTVVACGARFSAHDHDGAPGVAGEASGGFTSSAGSSSVGNGGQPETGGSSTAGSRSTSTGGTGDAGGTGGTGGAVTATGGAATATAGSGGRGGWWPGSGGGTSLSQCATLRQEYQASIEKARVCDKDSADQCSPKSVAPPISGCACGALINTKSAAGDATRKAYQAYLDAKCEPGPICDIACPIAETANCQAAIGTGTFVCTGDGLQAK